MTDMPFALSNRTIVIVRGLPVVQCIQCSEKVIADMNMERVDNLLHKVDPRLELEVVEFLPKECSENHIYEKVVKALQIFFIKDRKLLDLEVHEITISHKLSEYLQYEFTDMNVDCEYNRRGYDKKRRSDTNKLIRPDIVVHKRGVNENNFLVIEIKIEKDHTEEDFSKLKDYTNPKSYGYKFGIFIEIDGENKCISEVSCFQNGKKKPIEGTMWENLKKYEWGV